MKAKSLGLLVLALGCGLVASIGITQVMSKRHGDAAPAADTESVFIASQNIQMGEPLTPAFVKQEQWPKDRIPPGSVSKMEELEGHRTRTRIYAGEPILKSRISGKGADSSVSSSLPKGLRLVAVRVDAVSGTGSLILPGDHVDVLAHLQANPGVGIREPITRTILQNIKVFAVDATVNTENIDNDVKSIAAKTISLLVTPEQAQKVTLATEMGNVRLVLRSPEDDNFAEVPGVSARSLLGGLNDEGETGNSGNKEENKPGGGGLLRMLETAMQARPVADTTPPVVASDATPSPAPPVHAAPAVPKFIMRLVLGTKPSEVVMEPETDESGAPTNSGYWRSQETESAGGPAPTVENRPAPPAGRGPEAVRPTAKSKDGMLKARVAS